MLAQPSHFKTIQEVLDEIDTLLQTAKTDETRLNAEWILSESLGLKNKAEIYLVRDQEVSQEKRSAILDCARQRAGGTPLQYLFGNAEFFSLKFRVTPACLIPRPETEILVEHAIRYLTSKPGSLLRVLDIGTGSGNIAVAIAKNVPNCSILAIDISHEALKIAQENIETHQCTPHVELMNCDISKGLIQNGLFDLIVSNPPYIDEKDWTSLPDEIRLHEPRIALDGGEKGMKIISKVIENASRHLRPEGVLIMEIGGAQQTPAILEALNEMGCFQDMNVLKDYRLEDRIVKAVLR